MEAMEAKELVGMEVEKLLEKQVDIYGNLVAINEHEGSVQLMLCELGGMFMVMTELLARIVENK